MSFTVKYMLLQIGPACEPHRLCKVRIAVRLNERIGSFIIWATCAEDFTTAPEFKNAMAHKAIDAASRASAKDVGRTVAYPQEITIKTEQLAGPPHCEPLSSAK